MRADFGRGASGAKGEDTKPEIGAKVVKKGKPDKPFTIFGNIGCFTKAADLENKIKNDTDSAWKDADSDKDGYLSEDEIYSQAQNLLKGMYADLYDSDDNLTAEGFDMLKTFMYDDKFNDMDQDGNGSIDRGEFDSFYENRTFMNNEATGNGSIDGNSTDDGYDDKYSDRPEGHSEPAPKDSSKSEYAGYGGGTDDGYDDEYSNKPEGHSEPAPKGANKYSDSNDGESYDRPFNPRRDDLF